MRTVEGLQVSGGSSLHKSVDVPITVCSTIHPSITAADRRLIVNPPPRSINDDVAIPPVPIAVEHLFCFLRSSTP